MFSPTSIADFLACRHLTALNRGAAKEISKPYFPDPGLELLINLGNAHERAYLTKLIDQGLSVVEISSDGSRRETAARTIEAIRSGADVINQPVFLDYPVATAPGTDSNAQRSLFQSIEVIIKG